MILIDPQCGISSLALAGLLEALSEKRERTEADEMSLPSGGRVRFVYERFQGGLFDTSIEVRAEKDPFTPEFIDREEIEGILASFGDLSQEWINRVRELILEFMDYRLAAGKKPEAAPETVLATMALFSKAEKLKQKILSLPIGTGTGTKYSDAGAEPLPTHETLAMARKYEIPLKGLETETSTCDEAAILFLAKTGHFTYRMPSVIPCAMVRATSREGVAMRAVKFAEKEAEDLWFLEASLDDATGEEMGLAIEILQEASLEAHIVQALGKKGRPLFLLRVLAREEQFAKVMERFFKDTPTIGVRYWPVGRCRMERNVLEGELVVDGYRLPTRIKISRLKDVLKGKAEAEDIARNISTRQTEDPDNEKTCKP